LTVAASRSIGFIDKDSAEHATTIFVSAWPHRFSLLRERASGETIFVQEIGDAEA
jgi:hypothetical protein